MLKNSLLFLALFVGILSMNAQMDGISQPEEQFSNQAGDCTGIIATLNLNVDNLTNVGNGDVIVQITQLQGGALVESISMSNDMTMDYPFCVSPGCYRAKIVANGANVGFVCTLTVEGNDYVMTYNSQNISFGTDLCIEGCMQTDACNYNPDANISDYASCVFQEAGFDCDGNCLGNAIDGNTLAAMSPVQFAEAECGTFIQSGLVFATVEFDNDGTVNYLEEVNGEFVAGENSGTYTIDNGCLVTFQGTDYMYNQEANSLESLDPDPFYAYYYGATCSVGISQVVNEGCTNDAACNYDADAVSDDGSCEFLSCSCGTAIYDIEVEQGCVDLEVASLASGDFDFGCEYPSDFNIAWNGSTDTGYLIPSSGATAAYIDVPFCDITYMDATSASYVSGYGLADVYGFTPNNTFIVSTQDGNYYAIGDIQVVDIQPTAITIDFAIRLIEETVVVIEGCTNDAACNYAADATQDDGSCEFLSCSCGTAIYDIEVEQGCVDLEVASLASGDFDFGCEYPSDFNIAWNGSTDTGYLIPSSGATAAYIDVPFCDITFMDATSASYVSGYGLADVYGFTPNNTFIVSTQDGNYYAIGDIQVVDIQPTAITIDFAIRLIEETVVVIEGCTNDAACNYDADAVSDDGSCEFISCAGCTNATACNYDASATIDDGSCDFASCFGCTDVTACNYDAAASSDDGSCEFVSCAGCTNATACNYDASATIDDGSCEFTSCVGCMFELACNYDASATIMDHTLCDFNSCLGCTYPDAENYNDMASIDDGSCTYGECVTCMGDFNNDGSINSGDLLVFLGVFGGTCEEN